MKNLISKTPLVSKTFYYFLNSLSTFFSRNFNRKEATSSSNLFRSNESCVNGKIYILFYPDAM